MLTGFSEHFSEGFCEHLPYFYSMPLSLHRDVAEKTKLGIWKIEESAEWFRSQLKLDDRENQLIDSIKHPMKKLHWLSSRLLLRILMNNPRAFIHLESDERGKPVIHNFPVKISISHSAELSALLLSENLEVGIDIEKIDRKIKNIQHKFLREEELQNISGDHHLEHIYVYWCAKEAMYKLHGRKQLDFREHLFVEPFSFTDSGTVTGSIRKNEARQTLKIFYEKINGYMMAYVTAPSSAEAT